MTRIEIEQSLLVGQPITNGFTWTLATRTAQILQAIESQYGDRDTTYTLSGVEFKESPPPQIWYPQFPEYPNPSVGT
jgi:hypothetical protein